MAATISPAPHHGQPLAPPPLRLIEGGRSSPSRAALYRRRRVVAALALLPVLALVGVVGYTALGALRPNVPGAHAPAVPVAGGSGGLSGPMVVVRPGDTLWSIARRSGTGGDVRAVVDRLAAVHGTGPLQVGERLPLAAAQGGAR